MPVSFARCDRSASLALTAMLWASGVGGSVRESTVRGEGVMVMMIVEQRTTERKEIRK